MTKQAHTPPLIFILTPLQRGVRFLSNLTTKNYSMDSIYLHRHIKRIPLNYTHFANTTSIYTNANNRQNDQRLMVHLWFKNSDLSSQSRDAAVAPIIPVEAIEALDPNCRVITKIRPDTTALAGGGRGGGRCPWGSGDCSWGDGGRFLVPETGVLN